MGSRKHDFREEDKLRALLWCARHCCLCGKATGIGIEIAHLDPKRSDFDNAIPLCFDCHAAVGHYNKLHPRGRKYSIQELKARRDQIYEQNTRRLVPPVEYKLRQGNRLLPDVGFEISNLGNTYPIKATVRIDIAQGQRFLGPPDATHYNGLYLWNLNPGFVFMGHFGLGPEILPSTEKLRARVAVTLVDIYDRRHQLLPVGYVYAAMDWYFEPAVEALDMESNQPPKAAQQAAGADR